MINRRLDPRTDRRFSLRNLLNLRSNAHDLSLAVVGTRDGVLMAGSREDGTAERALAHASAELGGRICFSTEGQRTGGRLAGMRLVVDGEPVVLAIMDRAQRPLDGVLEEMADRIKCILGRAAIAHAA